MTSEANPKTTAGKFLTAIESHDVEEVKRLIEQGVDSFRFLCDFGDTPVGYAVEEGSLTVLQTLISSGFEIDWGVVGNPIDMAVKAGRVDLTLALLDAGLDVNTIQLSSDHKSNSSWTILMTAAQFGHLELVKLLIDRGADVNVLTNDGKTALWFAASQGWQEIFNYLNPLTSPQLRDSAYQELERGLLYRSRTEDLLVNDLIFAVGQGDFEAVQSLIANGVNIDGIDANGNNALHYAAFHGRLEIVRWLVEQGANLELAHERYLTTPLITAVRGGWLEITHFLIQVGAKIDKIYDGDSLLIIAVNKAISCRLGKVNPDRWVQIRIQYLEIIKALIQAGIDIYSKDSSGNTALDIATSNGDSEVATLLEHPNNSY
jgi:uncharacterized protein